MPVGFNLPSTKLETHVCLLDFLLEGALFHDGIRFRFHASQGESSP